MEPTLFKFVWRFSRTQQLIALSLAVAMFPLQYLMLEIPKVIINDAIDPQGGGDVAARLDELFWLCAAFLTIVVASGLLKMAMNLYKGRIGERLMRRLRFILIDRMLHFPLPEFRRTSQGEVVSMVTGEVEPLGGVMSEAVAQPVFLAGQMLTILVFLFMQSFWLGLASVAFIPLQAYVIPLLQRQLNKLQRERIKEVRKLSSELGDTVAAVEDLRANNGVRRREAAFSRRLGRIFDVRLKIYRKKYFMKFLNNFINQITPFLYFSIGGYLAIQGELTVGALVAALAAYKDLTNPWKELLAYVNQLQDMSSRYIAIVQRFSPAGVVGANAAPPGEPTPLFLQTAARALCNAAAFADRNARKAARRTVRETARLRADLGARAAAAAPLLKERRFKEALGAAAERPDLPTPAPEPDAPPSVSEPALREDAPPPPEPVAPRLNGAIKLDHLSIGAPGDSVVFERVSAELPAGGDVAIIGGDAMARAALAQVLARTAYPNSGEIRVGDVDLTKTTETAAATRIGLVAADPKLFERTIWENVRSGLAAAPTPAASDERTDKERIEALASGNSLDPIDARWFNPSADAPHDEDALRADWLGIVERFGYRDAMARRGLEMSFAPDQAPELARGLVALRPRIAARLRAEGLADAHHRFDPKGFNQGLTIAENLVFGVRRQQVADEVQLDRRILSCVDALGISVQLQEVAGDFLAVLTRTFRGVAPDHRLFARLGGVSPELLERLSSLDYKLHRCGPTPKLSEDDLALLQELLFRTPAEQIGQGVSKHLRNRILTERNTHSAHLLEEMGDLFAPIAPDRYVEPLSALENALYGRLPLRGSSDTRRVREIVLEAATEAGLDQDLAQLAGDAPVGPNGVDLTPRMRERIALARAIIKRPDILVLEDALHAHTPGERARIRRDVREMLPETTLILLDEEVEDRDGFDAVFEIQGDALVRIDGVAAGPAAVLPASDIVVDEASLTARGELTERIRILARTDTFRGVGRKQLRLLAFASEWIEVEEGEAIFRTGDPPDGVYVIDQGRAEIRRPDYQRPEDAIAEIEPGRIIGDLAVLRDEPRSLDFVATAKVRALKIGAEEFLDILRSDQDAAMNMLMAIAGNLTYAAERLRELMIARDAAESVAREATEGAARKRPGGGRATVVEAATKPERR